MQVLTECCLYGSDLAAAICGCVAGAVPADFKVQEAFRVVLEDEEAEGGGSSTTGATLQCLWHVLDGWDTARKHLFVKFVTGTDRCGFRMPSSVKNAWSSTCLLARAIGC